ncbi:acyltransferase [Photobacterium sp. CCB-ST2H9]|uniref:acyltransferase family protein n=1 Tax=Photobacterium sp. CCB-ST2H9 TaxID=2912855 RepID=UPI002005EE3E|nr:acyltransferase [Photobacterium sp. CCB-ST2H9]UTM59360.1 acyltransferase [Photobacterium sp. CCB-ST2H9]
MQTKPGQLPILTPIRGIAALIVAFFHARLILFPQWKEAIAGVTQFLENGYLWVDIFFMLSGFVMMHVYLPAFANGSNLPRWRAFLWLRFSRIYPLFFITFAVLFLWEYYKSQHQIGFYGGALFEAWGASGTPPFAGPFNRTEAILPNLLLLNGIGSQPLSWNIAGWSLSIEWLCYLVFPLLVLAMRPSARRSAWVPFAVFMTVGTLVYLKGNLDITATYQAFLRGLCGFSFGMWLCRIQVSVRAKHWMNQDVLLVVLIAALMTVLHFSTTDSTTMITYVLFALLVLAGAHQVQRSSVMQSVLDNRITQYLGDISYSIYLWHTVILLAGVEIIHHINPDWTTWWYAQTDGPILITGILAFTVLLLAVSAMSYHLIERPVMKWLRRLGGTQITIQVSQM